MRVTIAFRCVEIDYGLTIDGVPVLIRFGFVWFDFIWNVNVATIHFDS